MGKEITLDREKFYKLMSLYEWIVDYFERNNTNPNANAECYVDATNALWGKLKLDGQELHTIEDVMDEFGDEFNVVDWAIGKTKGDRYE